MVTDGQVRRLLRELDSGTSLATAAERAGMTDKTARHYRDDRTLPSTRKKSRVPRSYRTRPDPFAAVWPMVEQRLAAEPADVAGAIDWLLGPESSWVTGQVLGVDGGLATVRTR